MATVAINGRAAIRSETGGVERTAKEMALRLPALRPDRYRVITPPARLAHGAGHAWEQVVLPLRAAPAVLYSAANLAPVLYGGNAVVIHDVAALTQPDAYSPLYVAYQRQLIPRIAARARLLITVSRFSAAELVAVLGVDPGGLRVVPGGVDERFTPTADPAPPAQRYGLRHPYVLVVGTVSDRKNLGSLQVTAEALRARQMELVVAGSGRGYLRGEVSGLRRLGYVPDELLPGLYAGARALVMPSRHEGFGLPVLEAMACGTPVVAAARGALPDTVGAAGLLVDPDRPGEVAEAVLALVDDGALRQRLIPTGLERAARFTWERSARETDTLLGELIA